MEENNTVQTSPAPQKDFIGDFFSCKIKIFPYVIDLVNIFGFFVCIGYGIKLFAVTAKIENAEFLDFLPALCLIFFGPIFFRIALELMVVLFDIVAELREIRDRLPKE